MDYEEVMGYKVDFSANQPRGSKILWGMREYELYLVWLSVEV